MFVIYNPEDDTEGYIGYMPSNDSIYVVFRGSVSITNWITDMTTTKSAYTTFPECNCQVHDGFYHAEQRVIAEITGEVAKLRVAHPTASIKTTGHSLGAALAQLTAMDLVKAGYDVSMINFGQPRVGDEDYSTFVKTKMTESWRVVHNRDPVPHLPMDGAILGFW